MFQSPGNVFFQIGNHEVYYYSVCISLAIIVGTFVAYVITKKYYKHIDTAIFENYTPPIIIGAILGARLYYVFLCWDYFSKHLSEIPMIWHGGLTIHGAIAGGVLVGFIKTRIDKTSFIECCDAAPWGLLVGQAIGRWGNFFNSEAFGLPTNLPWKLYIAPPYRPEAYMNYEYFHPTFLYEAIWNLLSFCLLFFVFRTLFKNIRGAIFFTYLILYSVGRILIENIRLDTVKYVCGIPAPTFISLLIIVFSIFMLFYITKHADRFKKHKVRS